MLRCCLFFLDNQAGCSYCRTLSCRMSITVAEATLSAAITFTFKKTKKNGFCAACSAEHSRQLANIMEHLATKEPVVSLGFRLKPGQGKNIEINKIEVSNNRWFGLYQCLQISIVKCLKGEMTQLEPATF